MARGSVRNDRAGAGPAGLPASHWKQFRDVRTSGQPETRIEHVLVGPSGVHVIGYLPPAGASVSTAVTTTAGSAVAVADLLPSRYGHRVRPLVCFRSEEPVAESVADVTVTSLLALEHILRESPVVLSTCEVADVAARLGTGLYPFPRPDAEPRRRGWFRRRAVVLAASSAAVVGAVVLASELVDATRMW